MLKTEVTQALYQIVMEENPSKYKGETIPVESVSWYDAIYFCNKLSELKDLTPVYSVNGSTNTADWNYKLHKGIKIEGTIEQNILADGYRLPTSEEWEYAAKGGEEYKYAGSNNIDEVGWYYWNSESKTQAVAQKKPNGFGLYDMSGNVSEWCWDKHGSISHVLRGGNYINSYSYCDVSKVDSYMSYSSNSNYGLRIVQRLTSEEIITAQAQISTATQSSVALSTPKPTPRQPTAEEMWAMLMGDDFFGTTSSGSSSNQKQQVSSSVGSGLSGSAGSGGKSHSTQKDSDTGNGGMDGVIDWTEGKSRKLIKPAIADIQLSDASKLKIESNLSLTISFTVNEAGDIPIESIKISPPLQWSDVTTDIQQYISRNWRFESSNSKGMVTFKFTIKIK